MKKEVKEEMSQMSLEQVREPDFIYDGEAHMIKIGSKPYQTFMNLLNNNFLSGALSGCICVTCWQFIGTR